MLDFRIQTFLKLCETKSYTNTAKYLKMTQPSVTQHIKYLQKRYNCQLFNYEGKQLSLTPEGEYLRRQAQIMMQNSSKIAEDLRRMSERHDPLRFGCPKDLSSGIVPRLIGQMLEKDEDLEVNLYVDNSAQIVEELEHGRMDFILVDSSFDNGTYGKEKFADTSFSCWADPAQAEELSGITLRKLFRERLLAREEGAGSREILEDILKSRKCDIEDFYAAMFCNSPESIVELASAGVGVCFGFDIAMEQYAANNKLAMLKLSDFDEKRELVFLYLKDNMNVPRSKEFFKQFKKLWETERKA